MIVGPSNKDESSRWEMESYHAGDTFQHQRPKRRKTREDLISELPPNIQKALRRVLAGRSFDSLFSTGLGLPSRVKRYVRKIWKLEDKGKRWDQIVELVAPECEKILTHRMDVVVFTTLVKPSSIATPENIERLAAAVALTDAFLCFYSHYFFPGISIRLAQQCGNLLDSDKRHLVEGFLDIIDFSGMDSKDRRRRRQRALQSIESAGEELPKRSDR